MNLICCIADLNITNNSLQKTFVGIFSVGTRLLSVSNYFTSHIVAEQLFLLRHKTKSLLVLYIKVLGYYVGGFPPVQIGQRGSGQELALMLSGEHGQAMSYSEKLKKTAMFFITKLRKYQRSVRTLFKIEGN